MADADLKPRPSPTGPHHAMGATLRDAPEYPEPPPAPFIPWMQIADVWLKQAGFSPGQRMRIAFDYRNNCLIISPEVE